MERFSKRLGFGLLYLSILGAIGFGIYYFFFRPEPSCFDNRLNQEESEVDCGGPCIPCEVRGLSLEQRPVQVIPVGENQITLVAEITNPSPDYSAFFSYRFEVSSKVGGQLGEFQGKSFIGAGQIKYLVVPRIETDPDDLSRVNLLISSLGWNLSPILASYQLRVEEPITIVEGSRFKVSGKLVNNSASASPELRLVTIILNKEEEIIAASSSLISNVGAFSEKQFTVFLPLPLSGKIPPLSELETKIFWEEALQ